MNSGGCGESERQSRKRRVDPKLRAAGWTVVSYDTSRPLSDYDRCAIEEYPTDNGSADYARREGRPYEPASELLARIGIT